MLCKSMAFFAIRFAQLLHPLWPVEEKESGQKCINCAKVLLQITPRQAKDVYRVEFNLNLVYY